MKIEEYFRFDLWLKEQMEEREMNTEDLGKAAGLTRACIAFYLLGERTPTLSSFEDVLDALGKKFIIVDKETK